MFWFTDVLESCYGGEIYIVKDRSKCITKFETFKKLNVGDDNYRRRTRTLNNALVICNHAPTTLSSQPRERVGNNRGKELGFYVCNVETPEPANDWKCSRPPTWEPKSHNFHVSLNLHHNRTLEATPRMGCDTSTQFVDYKKVRI